MPPWLTWRILIPVWRPLAMFWKRWKKQFSFQDKLSVGILFTISEAWDSAKYLPNYSKMYSRKSHLTTEADCSSSGLLTLPPVFQCHGKLYLPFWTMWPSTKLKLLKKTQIKVFSKFVILHKLNKNTEVHNQIEHNSGKFW